MKFRKRPVTVEVWRNEPMSAMPEWVAEKMVRVEGGAISLFTLEGTMRADVGDWVVRGVKGEVYPVKPDIFEKTYEPGEPEVPQPIPADAPPKRRYLVEIANAAIERCAQVAQAGAFRTTQELAAAIRKLKDEPQIDRNIIHPGSPDAPGPFPEEGDSWERDYGEPQGSGFQAGEAEPKGKP
jgi:hypothetical protein